MAETLILTPSLAAGMPRVAANAASMQSMTLAVENMHCGGCIAPVESGPFAYSRRHRGPRQSHSAAGRSPV